MEIKKATKASFREATKLKNIWNAVVEWNGQYLATVQFHEDREWKVVSKGDSWEEIKKDNYKPIAEFHTQEELWEYLKSQGKDIIN